MIKKKKDVASRVSATFQRAHAHANRPGTSMRRDTNEKKAERGNARANEKKRKKKRKKKEKATGVKKRSSSVIVRARERGATCYVST